MNLRAHELLHDVPLYDVSVVDLPGGGTGRTLADVTRPYLIAIEPFRRTLYPAMLHRIRRAWLTTYGTSA